MGMKRVYESIVNALNSETIKSDLAAAKAFDADNYEAFK